MPQAASAAIDFTQSVRLPIAERQMRGWLREGVKDRLAGNIEWVFGVCIPDYEESFLRSDNMTVTFRNSRGSKRLVPNGIVVSDRSFILGGNLRLLDQVSALFESKESARWPAATSRVEMGGIEPPSERLNQRSLQA